MAYVKIPFLPGVFPDDTALAAEGMSVATDKVRFVRNKPQTIGGNESATDDSFNGICRSLFTWRDNTAAARAALGTIIKACNASANGADNFFPYYLTLGGYTKTEFLAVLNAVSTSIVTQAQKDFVAANWPEA